MDSGSLISAIAASAAAIFAGANLWISGRREHSQWARQYYADDASVVLFDGTPMFAGKEVMGEQYGKLFAGSPGLNLTIASRMTAADVVVDEEHVSGLHFGDMPTEMTAISVYQVTAGKISKLMLLF